MYISANSSEKILKKDIKLNSNRNNVIRRGKEKMLSLR